MPALAFAGTVIGNSVRIELKTGWTEFPTLWVAVVAAPGTGKSPALNLARGPLDALQANAEAGDHYYTTDATIEAIAVLASRSNGFAYVSDEIVGWVSSHNAYRAGGDRQLWLSTWSSEAIKVHRKGENLSVSAENPVVSVVGTVQPARLDDLAGEAGMDDGFLDRIIWVWPEGVRPELWNEEGIPEDVKRRYDDCFAKLAELRSVEAATVRLDQEAAQYWPFWYDGNVLQQRDEPDPRFAQALAKEHRNVPRIALILHCLEHGTDAPEKAVPCDTLDAAARIVGYVQPHLRRVFSAIPDLSALAVRLKRILESQTEPFNLSALHKRLGGKTPQKSLRKALAELRQQGMAEMRIPLPGRKGGRPGELWRSTHPPK